MITIKLPLSPISPLHTPSPSVLRQGPFKSNDVDVSKPGFFLLPTAINLFIIFLFLRTHLGHIMLPSRPWRERSSSWGVGNPGLTCLELQVNPTFCVCQEWSAMDHKTLDAWGVGQKGLRGKKGTRIHSLRLNSPCSNSASMATWAEVTTSTMLVLSSLSLIFLFCIRPLLVIMLYFLEHECIWASRDDLGIYWSFSG